MGPLPLIRIVQIYLISQELPTFFSANVMILNNLKVGSFLPLIFEKPIFFISSGSRLFLSQWENFVKFWGGEPLEMCNFIRRTLGEGGGPYSRYRIKWWYWYRSCWHKALLSSSMPASIVKDSQSAPRANRSRQRQAKLHTVGLWWPKAEGTTASLCAVMAKGRLTLQIPSHKC